MADDRLQDVINSPWLQLGVPIAATAATAIAPRHAARTSAMALGGLRTVDAYGASRARLQQTAALHQQGLDKLAADDTEFDSLIDGDAQSGEPANGTAGGTAPESMANGKTQSLENGVVPRMTQPSMSPQDAAVLKRLHKIDPKGAQKLYEDRVGMRQKQDFDEQGAIDPADMAGINVPPGGAVSNIRLRNHMTGSFNPPAPQLVHGHEGGREFMTPITEGQGAGPRIDTGQHDEPGAEARAPHFQSYRENGKLIGVFATPNGVVKRITMGTPDKSPEEMASNLKNKLAMRSVGKPTGDAQFDQQFADPKAADDLLKKLSSTNMADVMMELVKKTTGTGADPVPGQ